MITKNETIPIRLSQLLRYCSVGSIVRGPDYLLTVKDIRFWVNNHSEPIGEPILYADQVLKTLGIEKTLRTPPHARVRDNGTIDGDCIPAMRFPFWMSCPSCGLLFWKPWQKLNTGEKPCCSDPSHDGDSPELKQVPWVLVHSRGYLADVPWHYLVHRNNSKPTERCPEQRQKPYLRLIGQKTAFGRTVLCNRCGAMEENFRDALPLPFGQACQQPWVNEPIPFDISTESAKDLGVVIEINDTRVHIPVTCSGLVIPPESRIEKSSVVARLYLNSAKRREIDQARTAFQKKTAMRQASRDLRCTIAEIEKALIDINSHNFPPTFPNATPGSSLEKEYKAFLEELPDLAEDEDFVPHHLTINWHALDANLENSSCSRALLRSVDRLISVQRLKEILISNGFKRIGGLGANVERASSSFSSSVNPGYIVSPDLDGTCTWLPGLELFGEGIFFTLDESLMREWEAQDDLQKRSTSFQTRLENSGLYLEPPICPDPRFLLLHTLSHLLIRQLEIQSGYPAASLKERIYSDLTRCMAGVLVYTTVPDINGTLGGLAELAEPVRFLRLLSAAFTRAAWCSLDPVCSEQEGQGPRLLNRAACHACALIPETSCVCGNTLLDRGFIKGIHRSSAQTWIEIASRDLSN